MKQLMWPMLPPTTMSMPFMEIPQRAPASPSITNKPPRAVAPAAWEALPLTRTEPDIMFGATDADIAVHGDAGFLVHARAVVAGVAPDIDGHGFVDADGQVVSAVG
jgi:hypothetical protein